MGLDLSHGDFSCSYRTFNSLRGELTVFVGLGCLSDYAGMGGSKPWPTVGDEPLVAMLNHSDCDGIIDNHHLKPLAERLFEVHLMGFRAATNDHLDNLLCAFADACDDAADNNEILEFR